MKFSTIVKSIAIILCLVWTMVSLIMVVLPVKNGWIIGLVSELVGLVFILVFSLLLWALGRLVENTTRIANSLEQIARNDQKNV